MDALLVMLAQAIASGVSSVAGQLVDKGIVDPALEPLTEKIKQRVLAGYNAAARDEALLHAVQAAIKDASKQTGEPESMAYAQKLNLQRIVQPGKEPLRDELMRLVFLASSNQFLEDIPDSILSALDLEPSQRGQLAEFLFYLRRRLNSLPDVHPLLEAGHQEKVETALRQMRADLTTLANTVTESGEGFAVRTVAAEPDWDPSPYLRYLASVCNLLPLGVIDPQYASPTSEHVIKLVDVYVDLEEASVYGRKSRNILDAISSSKSTRHVLLGAPGAGKSTFVNFLAYALALDQIESNGKWLELLPNWKLGPQLPVRVVLREWVAWSATQKPHGANAQALWDYIGHDLESHGFGPSFEPLKDHLQERGGIILLDGLDEVPDAKSQREIIKQVIEDFAHSVGLCQMIVTCRPYAYQKSEWRLSGFSEVSLGAFNADQIEDFVRRWYNAVVQATGLNSGLAEVKANSLIAACHLPYLVPLAEQPLLLTLMATLHTSRGNLPEDRADLYEDCVKLMLDYWQQSKRMHVDGQIESEKGILDALEITRDRLEQALNEIAFVAHERQGRMRRRQTGTGDISGEELRAVLAPMLENSLDKANITIHYIRTRAGLIMERGPDTFAFPHRTFQEFLTARYLLNSEDFPSNLAEWAHTDRTWWQEVFLLAAGHARQHAFGQAVALINELSSMEYHAGLPINGEDAYAAALAARAAVEVRLRERATTPRYFATLRKLQDWLAGIIEQGALSSKERAEVGVYLNALHDLRPDVYVQVPFLVPVPAGPFIMGEDLKQFTMGLGEYWIGKYVVTNAQFRRFIDDGGYTEKHKDVWTHVGWDYRSKNSIDKPRWWDHPQLCRENHPVVGVSWYEAIAYCNWLTKTDSQGRQFRLPSEAEWEKSARGTDGRQWPWGNSFENEKANTRECAIGNTTTVGLFPQGSSPYLALDLAGNVAEWCSSVQADYPYTADDGREYLESDERRCVRGGSWRYGLSFARCAYRLNFGADERTDYVGFRVAASPKG